MKSKKTPKLRFSEFDGEWQEKKLGELSSGSSYGMNSAATSYDGKNKYLRITDISSTTNDFLLNDLVSPSNKLDDKYLLEEGDILFARTGASVGKSYYYKKEDGIVYFAGFLIRFQIKDKFSHKFIFYNTLTNTYDNWVTATSMRSGQPGINETEYSDFKLFLPSKKEQDKIGKFFELLDQNLKAKEKEIKKMNELKKAYMQQIFNQEIRFKDENGQTYQKWQEIKLGEVANIKTGHSNVQDSIENGKYNFFDRSVEIKKLDTYDYDEEAIIYPGEGSKFFPRYYKGKYGLHQRAYSITSAEVDIKYLKYMLMLRNEHFLKTAVGSTVKSLRMNNFESCPIFYPEREEQKKIGNFLSLIDQKIELKNQELEKIKKYKKAFLEKMFV